MGKAKKKKKKKELDLIKEHSNTQCDNDGRCVSQLHLMDDAIKLLKTVMG